MSAKSSVLVLNLCKISITRREWLMAFLPSDFDELWRASKGQTWLNTITNDLKLKKRDCHVPLIEHLITISVSEWLSKCHCSHFLHRLNNIKMQNDFLKKFPRMAEITVPTNYLDWKSKQLSLPFDIKGLNGRRDQAFAAEEPHYLLVRSDDANPRHLGITQYFPYSIAHVAGHSGQNTMHHSPQIVVSFFDIHKINVCRFVLFVPRAKPHLRHVRQEINRSFVLFFFPLSLHAFLMFSYFTCTCWSIWHSIVILPLICIRF